MLKDTWSLNSLKMGIPLAFGKGKYDLRNNYELYKLYKNN